MQVKTHTVALDVQDMKRLEKLVPELPAAFQEVGRHIFQLKLACIRISMLSNASFNRIAVCWIPPPNRLCCIMVPYFPMSTDRVEAQNLPLRDTSLDSHKVKAAGATKMSVLYGYVIIRLYGLQHFRLLLSHQAQCPLLMHTYPVSVQVDVLVNNAGLALGKAPAQDNDVADISVMLDTNCRAVAVLTKSVAKGMIERNRVHFPF